MLLSCYLLQTRFESATPLAPTALPSLVVDSRAPTMSWEPCGSAHRTRETGRLEFRMNGSLSSGMQMLIAACSSALWRDCSAYAHVRRGTSARSLDHKFGAAHAAASNSQPR